MHRLPRVRRSAFCLLLFALSAAAGPGCIRPPCTDADITCNVSAWLLEYSSCPATTSWHTHVGSNMFTTITSTVRTFKGGGLVVSGLTTNDFLVNPQVVFSGTGGTPNFFMIKFDANGYQEWSTYLGRTASGLQRIVTDDNAIVFAGDANLSFGTPINAFQGGSTDMLIARLDSRGGLLWHTYHGSAQNDAALGVAFTSTGDIVVGGVVQGDFAGSAGTNRIPHQAPGTNNAGLIVVDTNGIPKFNTIVGNGTGARFLGVTVGLDGSLYGLGESNAVLGASYPNVVVNFSGGATVDGLLVKFLAEGNYLLHTYQGEATANQRFGGAALQADGTMIVGASSQATYGSPLNPHASSGTAADFALSKYDSNGALQWLTFIGGTGTDDIATISPAFAGQGTWVGGQSTVAFGSPLAAFPHSGGPGNGTLLRIDTNGNLQTLAFFGASTATTVVNDVTATCDIGLAIAARTNAAYGTSPINAYPGGSVAGLLVRLDTYLGLSSR